MIFYIWKKSNLDDEFTVGFNAGTRKTFWEMKRLIGKYGEKTIWKRFLEYKSSFHWNFHWKLSNIESSFFWHFEGKLISAKEIWERICMFCANIPPQISSSSNNPLFLEEPTNRKHFPLSMMTMSLLSRWLIGRAANRGGAEEEDARRGGGLQECWGASYISVQLFIGVTLFMKKDKMSGGDKMIKR